MLLKCGNTKIAVSTCVRMKQSDEHVVERLNLVSCKVATKIKSDEFGSSIGVP